MFGEMNLYQQQAFWSKVDISSGVKACWLWFGARKPNGYGNLRINKKYMLAHRVAFELANKIIIPDGLKVCHVCDNPPCCNPNHLMLGTVRSNAADMVIKGRAKNKEFAARGSINGRSKFTENQIIELREIYKTKEMNQYELARKYGVTQACIGAIVRRQTWRHV
jgi:hypothetical protein